MPKASGDPSSRTLANNMRTTITLVALFISLRCLWSTEPTPAQREFLEVFKQCVETKNVDGLMNISCFDGFNEEQIQQIQRQKQTRLLSQLHARKNDLVYSFHEVPKADQTLRIQTKSSLMILEPTLQPVYVLQIDGVPAPITDRNLPDRRQLQLGLQDGKLKMVYMRNTNG